MPGPCTSELDFSFIKSRVVRSQGLAVEKILANNRRVLAELIDGLLLELSPTLNHALVVLIQ